MQDERWRENFFVKIEGLIGKSFSGLCQSSNTNPRNVIFKYKKSTVEADLSDVFNLEAEKLNLP